MATDQIRISCKTFIGQLWRIVRPRHRTLPGVRKCVLIYHSVGENRYSIPIGTFERQMRYLAKHTRVVPLHELLLSDSRGDVPTCAITFDDGYASVYDRALPILKKHKFPASLYITTGLIGERKPQMSDADCGLFPSLPMLTWCQIRNLKHNGFTLGTHLVHHVDLTAISRDTAIAELTSSRNSVENYTDTECVDFAYPWGRANRGSAVYLRETGYRFAVTAVHKVVTRTYDPMFIPRMHIQPDYNLSNFRSILLGDWDYLGLYHDVRKVFRTGNSLPPQFG